MGGQVVLPFLSPSVPLEVLIKNQSDSDCKTKTTVLTAPIVKAATDKVQLTSEEMDLVYQLAIKYRNNSLSTEDLIAELRGGALTLKDWVGGIWRNCCNHHGGK